MQTSEPGSCHFLPSGSSTVPPTNLNPGSTKNQFLLCSWALWRKLTQPYSLASAQSPQCSWWVIFLNPNPECIYTPFKVLPNFWMWLFRPFIVCLSPPSIPNISVLLSLPALFSPNDSHSFLNSTTTWRFSHPLWKSSPYRLPWAPWMAGPTVFQSSSYCCISYVAL